MSFFYLTATSSNTRAHRSTYWLVRQLVSTSLSVQFVGGSLEQTQQQCVTRHSLRGHHANVVEFWMQQVGHCGHIADFSVGHRYRRRGYCRFESLRNASIPVGKDLNPATQNGVGLAQRVAIGAWIAVRDFDIV